MSTDNPDVKATNDEGANLNDVQVEVNGVVPGSGGGGGKTTEEVEDIVAALLTAGSNITINYDDDADTLTISASGSSYTDEEAQDAVGTILQNGLTYDDADNTIGQNVVTSGQVTLSSGTGVVDTGISATDATFQLALGVDDPAADAKITGRLFWDDSAGTYKVEFVEDGTSVGNPTVNFDIIRIR